jgi:hypothetical protein
MPPQPPKPVVQKVRKLAEIAAALRQGQDFSITRLTTLKGLCEDPRAAHAFALFLARHARQKLAQGKAPEPVKQLGDQAVTEMEEYLDEPSDERKDRLRALLREVEAQQNEFKRVSWNQVRLIHFRDLLVIEEALRCLLADRGTMPIWAYQAARDYAEQYNPRYGTGLIPSSAPMMEDIAGFWADYFGIGP